MRSETRPEFLLCQIAFARSPDAKRVDQGEQFVEVRIATRSSWHAGVERLDCTALDRRALQPPQRRDRYPLFWARSIGLSL